MLAVFRTPRCALTSCVHSVARAGFGLPPPGERLFALAAALAFFPPTVFLAPGEPPFTLRDPAPFSTTLFAPRFPICLNPTTPPRHPPHPHTPNHPHPPPPRPQKTSPHPLARGGPSSPPRAPFGRYCDFSRVSTDQIASNRRFGRAKFTT